jgi:endonuclease YncB( thermonuclease family)
MIPGLIAAGAVAYATTNAVPDAHLMFTSSSSAAGVTFGECGIVRRTCVVDGDTVWLDGTKIRLVDIDAPEVEHYKCPAEKALGDRATRRLVEILNSGDVTVVKQGGRDEDQYHRKLRIVLVNGRSAGSVLVSEGLARPWEGKRRPWC